jgi:hypothetical protein
MSNLPPSVWLESTRDVPGGRQASYGMDSMANVSDLPPMSTSVMPGSDAFAALEKRLVILQSTGNWV